MLNNKRILLILPINSGTIARRAYDLYSSLIEVGIDVFVAVLTNSKSPEFIFTKEYIFHCNYRITVYKILFRVIWLRKLKNQIKPDISISTLNGCSVVNVLAGGKDFKIGLFRAPIEQLRDWNGDYYSTNFSYSYIFPKLDKLYCVSEEVRKSLLKNYSKINPNKVETVYNIFDIDNIVTLGKEAIYLDEFKSHEIIISVGRIEKIKGQDRLIKAYSLLRDDYRKRTKLVFMGAVDKDFLSYIMKIAEEHNVVENIIFLGPQINPYKYISQATIFVLSSLQEGLPGALIEALILHKPVISTNCSIGVWEAMSVENAYDPLLSKNKLTPSGIITPNLMMENGKYESDNVKSLSDAIEILITNNYTNYNFDCISRFHPRKIIDKYINPVIRN